MQLREVKFNVFFDYIRDIRRYSYDIENLLKTLDLYGLLDFVPPIPDEIEPLVDRLSIQKKLDNKSFIFKLSQLSFSIIIVFDENQKFVLQEELDYTNNIQKKIKQFLKENIPEFKITYESLSVAKEEVYTSSKDIKILDIDNKADETTFRISKEFENKYFIIEQKSALKTFSSDLLLPQFIFPKNKEENFIGWHVFLFNEINNRLAYNLDDGGQSNEIDFQEISELILNN